MNFYFLLMLKLHFRENTEYYCIFISNKNMISGKITTLEKSVIRKKKILLEKNTKAHI